jgi:hypothetical protein
LPWVGSPSPEACSASAEPRHCFIHFFEPQSLICGFFVPVPG